MTFKINNVSYKIIELTISQLREEYSKEYPNTQDNVYIYGRTDYIGHRILLNKDLCLEERIRTLKHELCHCWLWNTANANQETYNEEHICEIVACCNDFITEISEKYRRTIKEG